MSEMVERVAKAMMAADPSEPTPYELEDWLPLARAAIAAMREPTQAMRDACIIYLSDNGPTSNCWKAMIEEALK